MTAFKVWDGAAWNTPKWCTNNGSALQDPTWESYRPPLTDYPGEYTFDNDDEGWWTSTPEAHTWSPGEWRIYGVGDGGYRYIYGPTIPIDAAPKYKNYVAALEFYCAALGSANVTIQGYFYTDGAISAGSGNTGVFTYAGETRWMTFPVKYFDQISGISISIYGATNSAGYDIRMRSGYIRREDGTPIMEYYPGAVPKVWDGAQWVAQDRA